MIACEYSGRVRDAFVARGHDAISADLLPTEQPGKHYQGNVLDIIGDGFDLMIAHPPCTYLCNTSVQWLHKQTDRWPKLDRGAEFFKAMIDAPIEKIAIENPIMHKYAVERIGGVKHDQLVQPYMFGHMESKATCFWLKNLPPLRPTKNVKDATMKLPKTERNKSHLMPKTKDQAKNRSLTYLGIAEAMAKQWG